MFEYDNILIKTLTKIIIGKFKMHQYNVSMRPKSLISNTVYLFTV